MNNFESAAHWQLNYQEIEAFLELMDVWNKKKVRNFLRSVYVEGKQPFKDLGIAIPDKLREIGQTLEWPKKGVSALVDRINLEGFVIPGLDDDPFDIEPMLDDNAFYTEFPQAVFSSAVHACSFVTVSQGDVEAGEPDVIIRARAADMSAAVWDYRRRQLKSFLTVVDVDKYGEPSELNMYLPDFTYVFRLDGMRVQIDKLPNLLGFVPVVPLVHEPDLNRPLGNSRVSRSGMYFTDAALRTIMRSEIQAEGFAGPQYWIMGATARSVVGNDRYKAVMGRIFGMTENEDTGELPDVKRFEAASPQPHESHLQMWAKLFAGDQSIPVSSLGVAMDNPESEKAMRAAKDDLINKDNRFIRSLKPSVSRVVQIAVMLRDSLDEIPDELRKVRGQFSQPDMLSVSEAADAFSKRAAAIDGFAETEVGLESAGLTREQIVRFREEQRRTRGGSLLDRALARQQAEPEPVSESVGESELEES